MTSLAEGQEIALEASIPVGGIAMGGDCGVAKVDVSSDGGRSWYRTTLGPDEGRYGFRRWDGRVPVKRGANPIMTRCWNTRGMTQPMKPIWNPGGYMRGNVETCFRRSPAGQRHRGGFHAGVGQRRPAGGRREISARPSRRCRQRQLHRLSFGEHGHDPACPFRRAMEGDGHQDARDVQGADRGRRRDEAADRRNTCSPIS